MRKVILLFSHTLSDEQISEAKLNYDVEEFMYLPKNLQNLWSSIEPELETISEVLTPLKNFLIQNSEKDDLVLVQGDFGAVFIMVDFCFKHNLVPIYATTQRVVKEYEQDNRLVKKSIFTFGRFRKYELV